MRVDPARDEEVVGVAVVEEGVVAFFGRVAGVGGGGLVWDDEGVDKERVGEGGRAEDSAGFEVAGCVGVGEVEEGGAEGRWEEDCAEGRTAFGGGDGLEGVL